MEYNRIEKIIGFKFADKKLLMTAFTTPAFANQMSNNGQEIESGDRLEFLGDGVLKYILTYRLYMSGHKTAGEMTEERQGYERYEAHAAAVDKMGLAKFMRLVDKQKVSDKMKCDLFEAIVAAIFLDKRGGLREVDRFVERALGLPKIEKIKRNTK